MSKNAQSSLAISGIIVILLLATIAFGVIFTYVIFIIARIIRKICDKPCAPLFGCPPLVGLFGGFFIVLWCLTPCSPFCHNFHHKYEHQYSETNPEGWNYEHLNDHTIKTTFDIVNLPTELKKIGYRTYEIGYIKPYRIDGKPFTCKPMETDDSFAYTVFNTFLVIGVLLLLIGLIIDKNEDS